VPLVSLGSLFYEPIWIYYRGKMGNIADLRGKRVNTGARGSGSPGLFAKLLGANHLEREELKRSNLEETPAVIALLGNELDALVLVSAPESPMVQMLLQTPGIRLYEFTQAKRMRGAIRSSARSRCRAAWPISRATCRRAMCR